MSDSAKLNGRCLCGTVRFTAAPKHKKMGVCHCGMCRRWSGGAFMAVECEGLEVVDGANLAVYRSSDWGERGFCRQCGTSLFWRSVGGADLAVSMQAFDVPGSFAFTDEIFIDEKPASYAFANATRKMTGAEVIEAFANNQEGGNG